MSYVDKFGRPLEGPKNICGVGERGPPGFGYDLDKYGNYTLKNKRLKLHRFDPMYNQEAVSLSTIRKYTLHKLNEAGVIDAGKHVITNLRSAGSDPTAAVTKAYVDSRYPMSVKQDKRGYVLLCGNKRLSSVSPGVEPNEAVTKEQVEKYVEVLRGKISAEIKEAVVKIKQSHASRPIIRPNIPPVFINVKHSQTPQNPE